MAKLYLEMAQQQAKETGEKFDDEVIFWAASAMEMIDAGVDWEAEAEKILGEKEFEAMQPGIERIVNPERYENHYSNGHNGNGNGKVNGNGNGKVNGNGNGRH